MSRKISQTETTTWTQSNGREIKVEQHLVTAELVSYFNDGQRTESWKPVCKIITELWVGGRKYHMAAWVQTLKTPVRSGDKVITAKIGYYGKEDVGVLEQDHQRIKEARARLEASPEWMAHLEAERKADERDEAYEAHRRMMDRAMNTERA